MNILISGGGTGGHIFPAVSIANAMRERHPEANILFVGAEDRMEMEKVPAAGYKIIGLPISGFDRKNIFKNIKVVMRLLKSMRKANKIIDEFKPDVAIGVGGYASGAALKAASRKGVPTVLQEQNSYAGVTNKMLASKASAICVAYEGMERFFPADRIILTGNPVRQNLLNTKVTIDECATYFGLQAERKTILVIGGSLGARTINESIADNIDTIIKSDIQLIWQTGKGYDAKAKELLASRKADNVCQMAFIKDMDKAYAIASLVISRAGASSISELSLLGKPCILVPSPNVAEDHQTKNAMALVKHDAAIMVSDAESREKLMPTAMKMVNDDTRMLSLRENILKMALPDSANKIADIIDEVIKKHSK